VLAVLGYSVNESVVIADRIRENFRKMRKANVPDVINNAITSTLSRTIITHGCTLMMVLSIFFFGGETLHHFALALAIGICFGIYSSALVMASLLTVGAHAGLEEEARRGRRQGDEAEGLALGEAHLAWAGEDPVHGEGEGEPVGFHQAGQGLDTVLDMVGRPAGGEVELPGCASIHPLSPDLVAFASLPTGR